MTSVQNIRPPFGDRRPPLGAALPAPRAEARRARDAVSTVSRLRMVSSGQW